MTSVRNLYLALPTYNGERSNTSAILAAIVNPGPFQDIRIDDSGSSFLTYTFNSMWAKALKARAEGVTHFLMLHADVYPHAPTWIADLFAIMERVNAQLLSVVLPLKDARGLTSTALEDEIRGARRLTMREIEARDPTFTDPALLLNTGLMLVDMRAPWVEDMYFEMSSGIKKDETGAYVVTLESEDWFFSRLARSAGVQLWATRELKATHFGRYPFRNFGGWGRLDTDDWS